MFHATTPEATRRRDFSRLPLYNAKAEESTQRESPGLMEVPKQGDCGG